MILRTFSASILLPLLLVPAVSAQQTLKAPPRDIAANLHALFDEEWQYELRINPEFATALGDPRYNDRLSDVSAEFFASDLKERKSFLARFAAIPAHGLSAQDALSLQLMVRNLREQIEGAEFKPWEMPVSQNSGPQIDLTDLITITPFSNTKDYDDYISRLKQIPRFFAQVTANMRQGMKDRLMPPRYLLEKVAPQAESVAEQGGESNPFYKPLKQFPESAAEPDQQRLREAALDVINHQVIPAYKSFAAFMRDEYAPHGRTEPGIWALPDGDKRYRYQVRRMTTTDLTPDQIHEIGLKELRKTEAEMLEIAHKFGYKDLATFNQHVKDDRDLYATSGQQLLDLYAKYVRDMEPLLPTMFGHLPKAKLVAIPMDSTREKNAVPADYTTGTPDGSRPGHINVNEYDPQHRLLLNV